MTFLASLELCHAAVIGTGLVGVASPGDALLSPVVLCKKPISAPVMSIESGAPFPIRVDIDSSSGVFESLDLGGDAVLSLFVHNRRVLVAVVQSNGHRVCKMPVLSVGTHVMTGSCRANKGKKAKQSDTHRGAIVLLEYKVNIGQS